MPVRGEGLLGIVRCMIGLVRGEPSRISKVVES